MVQMDSFNRVFFYPITFIFSSSSTNYITSCLGSRVDMISNLNPVSMIFLPVFNNYLIISAKCLGDTAINI